MQKWLLWQPTLFTKNLPNIGNIFAWNPRSPIIKISISENSSFFHKVMYFVRFLGNGVSRKNAFKIYWPSSGDSLYYICYLFKTWLWEISFGKFMTILSLWYFITKAFKNSTGGRDNFSAMAVAIIKSTKPLLVQTMSDLSSWIWSSDNTPVYYKLLYKKGLFYNNKMHFLMTF